jgi:hypothetical protein
VKELPTRTKPAIRTQTPVNMVLAQAIETLRLASSGVGLIPVVGPYLTSAVDIALQLCEIAQVIFSWIYNNL